MFVGLLSLRTNALKANNVTVRDNEHSFTLDHVEDARLVLVDIAHNHYGIALYTCENTMLENVSAHHNRDHGIAVFFSNNTVMRSVYSSHNNNSGIYTVTSNWTTLSDMRLVGNNEYGFIAPCSFNHGSILNLYSAYNRNGVVLTEAANVKLVNVTTSGNADSSIVVSRCVNTTVQDATVEIRGIIITQSHSTTIVGVTFGIDGMLIENSTHVKITISADDITQNSGFFFLYSTNVTLEGSNFSNIDIADANSRIGPMDIMAIITLSNTTLVLKNCNFIKNSISSIMASSSTIRVEGKVLFSNNSAVSGPAFIFSDSSLLILPENSNVIMPVNMVERST